MLKFIILFIIIVKIALTTSQNIINFSNKECNLYNDHYRGEYLYSVSSMYQHSFFYRQVLTWFPAFNRNIVKDARKSIFNFLDSDSQGIWHFIPVDEPNRPFTYYIKNNKYGEYLYASKLHHDFPNHRRNVFTWKDSKDKMDGKEYYMWELREPFMDPKKPNGLNELKFTLWNVAFNQSLYAANHFFSPKNNGGVRRRVFTYYKKPDEDKFNWFIVCRNDIYA
jgi:hypothetical protein